MMLAACVFLLFSSVVSAPLPRKVCGICICKGESMDCKGRGLRNVSDEKIPRTDSEIYTLDLSQNTIQDLGDADLCALSKDLIVLNISGNNISYIKPRAFRGLTSMSVLDLSSNWIRDISSDTFIYQTNLTELSLRGNLIKHIRFTDQLHTCTFTSIDLRFNNLNTLQVINCNSLTSLYLADNNVSAVQLLALPSLQVLDMSKTGISMTKIQVLKEETPNLVSLLLSGNEMPAVSSADFGGLARLEKLDLSCNNLTTIPAHVFAKSPCLDYVDLSHNQIAAVDSDAFSGHVEGDSVSNVSALDRPSSSISHLDLSHNRIRTLNASAFYPLPNSSFVNVAYNTVDTLEPDIISLIKRKNLILILDNSLCDYNKFYNACMASVSLNTSVNDVCNEIVFSTLQILNCLTSTTITTTTAATTTTTTTTPTTTPRSTPTIFLSEGDTSGEDEGSQTWTVIMVCVLALVCCLLGSLFALLFFRSYRQKQEILRNLTMVDNLVILSSPENSTRADQQGGNPEARLLRVPAQFVDTNAAEIRRTSLVSASDGRPSLLNYPSDEGLYDGSHHGVSCEEPLDNSGGGGDDDYSTNYMCAVPSNPRNVLSY